MEPEELSGTEDIVKWVIKAARHALPTPPTADHDSFAKYRRRQGTFAREIAYLESMAASKEMSPVDLVEAVLESIGQHEHALDSYNLARMCENPGLPAHSAGTARNFLKTARKYLAAMEPPAKKAS